LTKEKQKSPNKETETVKIALQDGEAKLIQNVGGTYILVKVPMVKENTYHHHPNHALTMKGVERQLSELSDWCNENESETHNDYMQDNMTNDNKPIQEEE
tara:strand:- start:21959 stop:22258 length:300 start_codon:yes stop_codon:yes gene_type:complete